MKSYAITFLYIKAPVSKFDLAIKMSGSTKDHNLNNLEST